MADFQKMRAQVISGAGFIAALDQSGGSTPKALRQYGVEPDAYNGEDEMFAEIQNMRARIITDANFNSDKVIGAILFDRTLGEKIDGLSVPAYVWEKNGVVPFLKIDKGLEDEVNGVQVMKPIPGLPETLAAAKKLGIFGTKERSVINTANADGIAQIVNNQFEVAKTVIAAGMVPILEPEVNIHSPSKSEAEDILANALMERLSSLEEGQDVMLKLTIPDNAGIYDVLADHPRVLRVVALSGGYSTQDACARLSQNSKMIASFSRALTEGLQKSQSDTEFGAALGGNIDAIYRASI
ncbi:MAG: fructose bisphosphate aldolase [Paracoccaceae bacterium]